jgi:hypothetical protein
MKILGLRDNPDAMEKLVSHDTEETRWVTSQDVRGLVRHKQALTATPPVPGTCAGSWATWWTDGSRRSGRI